MGTRQIQPSSIGFAILVLLTLYSLLYAALSEAASQTTTPEKAQKPAEIDRVTPDMLGVIVNTQDPLSQEIAAYYQRARGIPAENIINISFDPAPHALSKEVFLSLKQEVDKQTPEHVQFYALTWANTYRVACMSITSAFAFGFDEAFSRCDNTCARTKTSRYSFLSNPSMPFTQLGVRPTMMLAAESFAEAKALIDRGIAADGLLPEKHEAYLVKTNDKARNIRKTHYLYAENAFGHLIDVFHASSNRVTTADYLMFYFTGAKSVYGIEYHDYLPGAIADHLTSSAGQLTNSKQMSALEWLKAGATGSYGTVVEPCNHLGKFPNPHTVMSYYLKGHTLIESYWKSVVMPGQGVFIGEPLARPYAQSE